MCHSSVMRDEMNWKGRFKGKSEHISAKKKKKFGFVTDGIETLNTCHRPSFKSSTLSQALQTSWQNKLTGTLFVLLNEAVSSLDYIASNDKVINW